MIPKPRRVHPRRRRHQGGRKGFPLGDDGRRIRLDEVCESHDVPPRPRHPAYGAPIRPDLTVRSGTLKNPRRMSLTPMRTATRCEGAGCRFPSAARAYQRDAPVNRVLFVSTDQASADWQDAVRRRAGRWQVTFATSTAQALAALAESSYEVVIAEISAQQAEGLEVLAQVKAKDPETARIVLSEPIGSDLLPRVLELAHQRVAKPCEPDAFWKLVERTCLLYGLMNNHAIRAVLGGLDRLPSVPRSYVALTQAIARTEVSLREVAEIVERDTAMATKVLQLVNSAFFGRPRRISSIPVAVSLLGLDRLKALALGTHVFGMLSEAESRAYGLERLQERSLLAAHFAQRFLSASRYADEGFTVGLLLDTGKLLLAACLKDRYRAIVEEARQRETPVEGVEREQLGVSNGVVGACMLSVWGLPVTIVEAVAFRHAPSGLLHDETALVDAVHVADALADAYLEGGADGTHALVLDPNLMAREGMREKVRNWCAIAAAEMDPATRA